MNKTTVIYHSADFDGLFCREIARKFLPDAELIGWDFGDEPLDATDFGQMYILDLPVDKPFGCDYSKMPPNLDFLKRVIWIDHHKSSIESHPDDKIPGYRIDGVAACRLAWQWFTVPAQERDEVIPLPTLEDFKDRKVDEPLAVRLAGEYDIWDKRDPRAELFQHGLRSCPLTSWWPSLLSTDEYGEKVVAELLQNAVVIQFVRDNEYRDVITDQGFDLVLEGVNFLACCSHECDIRSHLFKDGIKPQHDALFGFTYTGSQWRVSLYHIPGKEHVDLLRIAKLYKGGGHPGACGFLLPKNHSFLQS